MSDDINEEDDIFDLGTTYGILGKGTEASDDEGYHHEDDPEGTGGEMRFT